MTYKKDPQRRLYEALRSKYEEEANEPIHQEPHPGEDPATAYLRQEASEPFEEEIEEDHFYEGGEVQARNKLQEVQDSFKGALGIKRPQPKHEGGEVDPQEDKHPEQEFGDVPNEEFLKALKKRRGY